MRVHHCMFFLSMYDLVTFFVKNHRTEKKNEKFHRYVFLTLYGRAIRQHGDIILRRKLFTE